MTQIRSVLLGRNDHARLLGLIAKLDAGSTALLYDELDAAIVLPDADLPTDVVAMGSVVTFRDLESGQESTVELVYPAQADLSRGRVSVLAPVGAALVGLRVGEQIAWPLPTGKDRHLEVVSVRGPSCTEP